MPAELKPNQAEIEMAREAYGSGCTCDQCEAKVQRIARLIASRREAAAHKAGILGSAEIAAAIRTMDS